MSFLTAAWNDLALINYEINPEILKKYVPVGTELDFYEDKCYVSLIGFMFENVRIKGIKVPFHTDFEEVNLRFYVKRLEGNEIKRGAVFIKEIVPKHAISIVANLLYKEHYETLKMKHLRLENRLSKTFKYCWKKSNNWNFIEVETEKNLIPIPINSHAEFITEHYFGYTKFNHKKTIEYQVTHPRWQQLLVKNYKIEVDFEAVYGNEFAFLKDLKPVSVIFAKGSKITIEGKKIIK
jgi:uncharacterized protein